MASVAPNPSLSAIRTGLKRALIDQNVGAAGELIDRFHDRVVGAVADHDRALLAELGGQAARLQNVVRSASSTQATEALNVDLRRIARTIEIAWTELAMRGARQEPPTPPQLTVRGRVLDALQEGPPQRPRDLAARLRVDRTQVSRALRQLERDGQAAPVSAPAAAEDRRAALWHTA